MLGFTNPELPTYYTRLCFETIHYTFNSNIMKLY